MLAPTGLCSDSNMVGGWLVMASAVMAGEDDVEHDRSSALEDIQSRSAC